MTLTLCLSSHYITSLHAAQLFQTLKIPHDIYYAARTRRIIQADQAGEEQGERPESPERSRRRLLAIAMLQRAEVVALIACILSPIAGASILHCLQQHLTDSPRYLNQFNIRLFLMAAGIRPWIHAFKLLRRRLLLLQEDVHYPSAKVEFLQRRLTRLEADLSSLRKSAASKSEIRILRDGIDVPLSQMSRSMRRYEKKEECLRNTAEDKFVLIETRLEDLLRECAINAELIEAERLKRERSSSLGFNVLEAVKFVLGQRASSSRPPDASRALPSTSTASSESSVDSGSPPASWPSVGGPNSPPWQGKEGLVRSRGNTSGPVAAAMTSDASSASSLPSYTSQPSSPPRNVLGLAKGALNDVVDGPEPLSAHSTVVSAAAPGSQWYERGLLYWAFFPVNLSNSVLRFAGDKFGARPTLTAAGSVRAGTHRRKMIGATGALFNPASTTEAAAVARQQATSLYSYGDYTSSRQSQVNHSPDQPQLNPTIHITPSEASETVSFHPAPSAFVPGDMDLGFAGSYSHGGPPGGLMTSLPTSYSSSNMSQAHSTVSNVPGSPFAVHWKATNRLSNSYGLKA